MRAIRRMDLGWLNPWLNQSKRSEAIAETQVTFEEIKRLILVSATFLYERNQCI